MHISNNSVDNKNAHSTINPVWLEILSEQVTAGSIEEQGGIMPNGMTQQDEVSIGMTIKVHPDVARNLLVNQVGSISNYKVRSLFNAGDQEDVFHTYTPTHFGACINASDVRERASIDDAYAEYPTGHSLEMYERFHSKDRDKHIEACFELFAHRFLMYSFLQGIPSEVTYPEHGFDIHCPPESIFVAVRTLFNGDIDEQVIESCCNTQGWTVLAVFNPRENHLRGNGMSSTRLLENWDGWHRSTKLLGIWVFDSLCFSDLSRTQRKLFTNPHHPISSLPKMLKWFESPKPLPLDFTGSRK